MKRRSFLKLGVGSGGCLVLGVSLSQRLLAENKQRVLEPNAWIRIYPDNSIRLVVDRVEMGQGVMTALPTLIAEELDVDPSSVKLEFAGVDKAYINPTNRSQVTGRSSSIREAWLPLREAGAAARMILIEAAAKTWKVDATECIAVDGYIRHKSGKQQTYGDFVQAASGIPMPKKLQLKSHKDFKWIGRSLPRLDALAKATGSAKYGMDVILPDMLIAVVIRCPVRFGRLKTYAIKKTMEELRLSQIMVIPQGLALLASNYWHARQAAKYIDIDWDEGSFANANTENFKHQQRKHLRKNGATVSAKGDTQLIINFGKKTLEAYYELPYLAHATMEPMNCTVIVNKKTCEIWVPTQAPQHSQFVAHKITGLDKKNISVHTTFLGGGFGRRGETDFVAEAVEIAQQMPGTPIKLVWSREDDMQNDYYRPASSHRLRAAMKENGLPLAWYHHIVGPGILVQNMPRLMAPKLGWLPDFLEDVTEDFTRYAMKNWTNDPTSTEGASPLQYAIENTRIEYTHHDPGLPVGFWRSVGSSYNAFVVESFMDEIAHAGGRDTYELRKHLLKNHARARAVLDKVAELANWGQGKTTYHLGIAQHYSMQTYVAQVAQVSVQGQKIKVHKVFCVVDCGYTINPDIVVSQMESSIVFGLSAALYGAITLHNGKVQETNFADYPLLRMDAMPEIEVFIMPSTHAPTGVGEPGTPPIAPAVANAVFAATGRRLRSLPLRL